MSQFQSNEVIGGGGDFNSVHTTKEQRLGQVVCAYDTATTDYGVGEFIYCEGVAATVLGSVVLVNMGDFSTTLAGANAVGALVATAMAPVLGSQYGWYQISGKAVAKVATGFASGKLCYLTATAGTIDDAVVAGDILAGTISVGAIATPAAGLALVAFNRPSCNNASN